MKRRRRRLAEKGRMWAWWWKPRRVAYRVSDWWVSHVRRNQVDGPYSFEREGEPQCGKRWFAHRSMHQCTHFASHVDGGKWHWDEDTGCIREVSDDDRPSVFADLADPQWERPPVGTRVRVVVYKEVGSYETTVCAHPGPALGNETVEVAAGGRKLRKLRKYQWEHVQVYPAVLTQFDPDGSGQPVWGTTYRYDTETWEAEEPDLSVFDDPRIRKEE